MAEKTGRNLKFLRENNTSEILKYLTIYKKVSRIKLSKELGLSKMTITNIVSSLIENGFLYETTFQEDAITTGPKPKLLAIRSRQILALGVYISRDRIRCSLTDIIGCELYSETKKIKKEKLQSTLISDITKCIQRVLDYDPKLTLKIVGIGISMVGLVDSEKGVFVRSTELLEDRAFPIKEFMEQQFHYPVAVQNDMQATALAEQIYGLGTDCRNFVYFGVTHGVGTAAVSDGKVLKGSSGFAVEAGHMSVDLNGPVCSCGNKGCVEVYISIPVLLKKTASMDVESMMKKYRKKERKTTEVMEEFIKVVSQALTNLSNIFDPEKIIIGYEGALFLDSIFSTIEENVNQACIFRHERKIEIAVSALKSIGPVRGAAAIVFQELFDGVIKLAEPDKGS